MAVSYMGHRNENIWQRTCPDSGEAVLDDPFTHPRHLNNLPERYLFGISKGSLTLVHLLLFTQITISNWAKKKSGFHQFPGFQNLETRKPTGRKLMRISVIILAIISKFP